MRKEPLVETSLVMLLEYNPLPWYSQEKGLLPGVLLCPDQPGTGRQELTHLKQLDPPLSPESQKYQQQHLSFV